MNKKTTIIFLVLGVVAFFLCYKKTYSATVLETIEPNLTQNRLYNIWSLYFQDSLAAQKQQSSVEVHRTFTSATDMQELVQLKNESLHKNSFVITDSISKKGTWLYLKENWYGRIDTLVELNINCVLGKIEKDNHSTWIIKRIDTKNKYHADFAALLRPVIKYYFDTNNVILSVLYLQFVFHQNKTLPSMFFTVQKSNLGYDKTDNTKMFCLMNASENIAWFYHKNVIIKEYGEFFEMCK